MGLEQKEFEYEDGGQDHVFAFYKSMTRQQQVEFDRIYDKMQKDFGDHLEKVTENFLKARALDDLMERGGMHVIPPRLMNWETKKPPPLLRGANFTRLETVRPKKRAIWKDMGIQLYSRGRVAVVVLCGGLDNRLGAGVPKGMVDVGLPSGKSIFQLFAERVQRLQHIVRRTVKKEAFIPVYIMCNKSNFWTIKEFFETNEYFGLRPQELMFFSQMDHPALDLEGRFLLDEKHKILQFPAGNGAVFKALADSGMVADMKSRGVTSLYICSIDNILTKVGDPEFIGFCENCLADCGIKCIKRLVPEETLGCFCSKVETWWDDLDGDGKMDMQERFKATVFEYFQISDDQRRKKKDNDKDCLDLEAGNLGQYYFRIDFIIRIQEKMQRLWHPIEKRLSHIDLNTGKKIHLTSENDMNGYRMEMWLFDAFEYSNRVAGLQVLRDECAVVKNRIGPDSAESALVALSAVHQQWILNNGGQFLDEKIASDQKDQQCEISPLVSYDGEGLGGCFLKPLALPFYLPSQQEVTGKSSVKVEIETGDLHYAREVHMEEASTATKKDNYPGDRADKAEMLPPTPENTDLGPRELSRAEEREKRRLAHSRRMSAMHMHQNVANEPDDDLPWPQTLEDLFPELEKDDEENQMIEIWDEASRLDHPFARSGSKERMSSKEHAEHMGPISVLGGWSKAALHGEVVELEHPFGKALGSTGVRNTGKCSKQFHRSGRYWTGSHVHYDPPQHSHLRLPPFKPDKPPRPQDLDTDHATREDT